MASATEKFVISICEISVAPESQNAVCTLIARLYDSLVKSPTAHLDAALGALTHEEHSLGILAILSAKLHQLEVVDAGSGKRYYSVEVASLDKLLAQLDSFVRAGNMEHVRYAVDTYTEMIHRMAELLIHRKEAIRGISIVAKAVERIRTSETLLTPTHTDLCHLCLSAKSFQAAFPFLDIDITDLQKPSSQAAYDSKAFLLYYYYGGMIYAVFKKFKRASYFFEIAISTPASVISAIMVQAYKKYILVNLISNSGEPLVPKFTAPVLSRGLKTHAGAYQDLYHSYNSSVQSTLQATADKHRPIFERDDNYGLVKQCIKSLYIKNIKKLTKTFLTLSITDVANRVHLPTSAEAEKYLLKMIENGEIYAKINKKDDMVEFHDNPEKYNNPAMLAFIQQQEKICVAVNKKMSDMEREISVTPDYVSKVGSYSADDDIAKPSTSAGMTSISENL